MTKVMTRLALLLAASLAGPAWGAEDVCTINYEGSRPDPLRDLGLISECPSRCECFRSPSRCEDHFIPNGNVWDDYPHGNWTSWATANLGTINVCRWFPYADIERERINIWWLPGRRPDNALLNRDQQSFNGRLFEAKLVKRFRYVQRGPLPIQQFSDGSIDADDARDHLGVKSSADDEYHALYVPYVDLQKLPIVRGLDEAVGVAWLNTRLLVAMSWGGADTGLREGFSMQHEIGHHLGIHHETEDWPGRGWFDWYQKIPDETVIYLKELWQ